MQGVEKPKVKSLKSPGPPHLFNALVLKALLGSRL